MALHQQQQGREEQEEQEAQVEQGVPDQEQQQAEQGAREGRKRWHRPVSCSTFAVRCPVLILHMQLEHEDEIVPKNTRVRMLFDDGKWYPGGIPPLNSPCAAQD